MSAAKIVFLDFDGVLVTLRSLKARSGRATVAEASCVAALNRITSVTGAKIVVSSAWRFCGKAEIKAILELWKVKAPVVGLTPDLTRTSGTIYEAVPRGREIQQWLEEHPVESFVILDDDADMEHLAPRLVQTQFADGLTEAHADQAIEILRLSTGKPEGDAGSGSGSGAS